jgi:hypothetical protein
MISLSCSPSWENKSNIGLVGMAIMAPHSSQMMTLMSSLEPLPAHSYEIPDSTKVSQEQRGQFGFFKICLRLHYRRGYKGD